MLLCTDAPLVKRSRGYQKPMPMPMSMPFPINHYAQRKQERKQGSSLFLYCFSVFSYPPISLSYPRMPFLLCWAIV